MARNFTSGVRPLLRQGRVSDKYVFSYWGVILGVRAQGVALSPNQPLNYRAQGFWPVTFGVDYTVNYPDFRVRGAMGAL
jgi:hypothetical protein